MKNHLSTTLKKCLISLNKSFTKIKKSSLKRNDKQLRKLNVKLTYLEQSIFDTNTEMLSEAFCILSLINFPKK